MPGPVLWILLGDEEQELWSQKLFLLEVREEARQAEEMPMDWPS